MAKAPSGKPGKVSKTAKLDSEPMLAAAPAGAGGSPSSPAAVAAPIGLDGVLGQEAAVRALRGAMRADRVHHAWVFHGPGGVGKFTAAAAFARELLDPADGSPTSLQVRSGTHPDLHVIRKEMAAIARDSDTRSRKQTNIPLEVLREFLIEPAALSASVRSASRATKVFIIDEADLMAGEGQNALLKTLEEPPPGSVIILVTSALERLLPTVRSRCQPVGFAPLDDAAMGRWLDGRPEAPSDRGARAWVLWFADGSPGLAALALASGLHAWHETLDPLLSAAEGGAYSAGLGPAMAKLVDEQAAAMQKANPDASKEAANRAWSRRMFIYLARRLRDRVRSNPAGAERAIAAIERCQEAERAISANVRFADVFENLSVQLAAGR